MLVTWGAFKTPDVRPHLKPPVGPAGAATRGCTLQLRQTPGAPRQAQARRALSRAALSPHHSPARSRDGLLKTETPGAELASSPLDKPVQTEASSTESAPAGPACFQRAQPRPPTVWELRRQGRDGTSGKPGKELFPNWKVQWGAGGRQCPLGPHRASVLAATARLFFLIEVQLIYNAVLITAVQ